MLLLKFNLGSIWPTQAYKTVNELKMPVNNNILAVGFLKVRDNRKAI